MWVCLFFPPPPPQVFFLVPVRTRAKGYPQQPHLPNPKQRVPKMAGPCKPAPTAVLFGSADRATRGIGGPPLVC